MGGNSKGASLVIVCRKGDRVPQTPGFFSKFAVKISRAKRAKKFREDLGDFLVSRHNLEGQSPKKGGKVPVF